MYDKVKALCDSKGISIAELEKTLEIGNGTIGKWKKHKIVPSLTSLQKIARFFEVPIADLIE